MRGVVGSLILGAGLWAAPALAQPSAPPSEPEMRALVEATREAAKAARENVDYARVVPDILTQILAKLDKIEDKLDKVENAIKREAQRKNTR